MGYIYIINCTESTSVYIGQTTKTIADRWLGHKYNANRYARYLENPQNDPSFSGTCTYLYRAVHKYGFDKFTISEICECPDTELDKNEIFYIEKYNSLAPNGFNLLTGGGHFKRSDQLNQIISEKVKKTIVDNIDRFRTSDKTKNMPPYVAYKNTGKYEAYYVNNHPLCKRKYFSSSEYKTIEKAKEECTKFLNELNTTGVMYKPKGPGGKCPKGMRPVKNGYQVRKTIKGKVIEKSFTGKTDDENFQNALNYINSLMEKEECSETKC